MNRETTSKKALVSCIITTYKRDIAILDRAIVSILKQTYDNIEIIVVNDNPPDAELSQAIKLFIETKHKDRVTFVQHSKNMGACAARNSGVQRAEGDFVAFLDDDDEWLPSKIEKQINAFTDDKTVLVYCNWFVYTEENGKKHAAENPGFTGNVYEPLMKDNFIGSTSYPLIKKEALNKIGGFDVTLPALQDYDVWVRLSKIGEIRYVNEPLVYFHVYAGERISNNPKKGIEGRIRFIENNKAYLEKNKRILGFRYVSLAHFYAKDRRVGKAIAIWIKGAALNPLDVKKNIFELSHVMVSIFHVMRRKK